MNAPHAHARPRRRVAGLLAAALAVTLCPCWTAARGQDKGKGLKLNQPAKRANGSANTLTGPVCVYNIFVEDRTSTWTQQERDAVRARVAAAADFIERKAVDYDRRVRFVLLYKEGVRHPDGLPTDLFANPQWTEDVIKAASGGSGNDLVTALKKAQRVDQVIMILHINKGSTSYALAYHDGIDKQYEAERAVCFNNFPDGQAGVPSSYAYQILSCFGAPTLFFPFDQDDSRKKLAQKLFPDDVMFRVDADIGKQSIGAYTAYRVGWLQKLADEHKVFED